MWREYESVIVLGLIVGAGWFWRLLRDRIAQKTGGKAASVNVNDEEQLEMDMPEPDPHEP
jgi:hypothetical protein